MISLIYAKSFFCTFQYIQCFELLQQEFGKFPVYCVFLYYYGKYVAMSKEEGYYGSGIGALQECKRVCVPERMPYIK